MKTYLHAKIHGLKVTGTSLHYEGSQTLPRSLMQKAYIDQYEQIHVVNVNNGKRWVTYAIEGEEGEVHLNGAAARNGVIGDELIILAYHISSEYPNPVIIHV